MEEVIEKLSEDEENEKEESLKIEYSKEKQKDIIASILNDPYLRVVAKVLSLKQNFRLNRKFVSEYLIKINEEYTIWVICFIILLS